jgi:hypothetical protein
VTTLVLVVLFAVPALFFFHRAQNSWSDWERREENVKEFARRARVKDIPLNRYDAYTSAQANVLRTRVQFYRQLRSGLALLVLGTVAVLLWNVYG